MAGYRRTNAEQVAVKTGVDVAVVRRPTQAAQRRRRRAESLDARLADARTPSDRISVAAGYLRSAMKHADPALADQIAEQVVRQLIQHGHSLLAG